MVTGCPNLFATFHANSFSTTLSYQREEPEKSRVRAPKSKIDSHRKQDLRLSPKTSGQEEGDTEENGEAEV